MEYNKEMRIGVFCIVCLNAELEMNNCQLLAGTCS